MHREKKVSKFPLQWQFVIQSSHFWHHDTKMTPVFLILTFYVVMVDSPLLVGASMCLAKRDHCLNALLSWSDVTLACSTFHFPGSSLKSQIFPNFLWVVYAFFMKQLQNIWIVLYPASLLLSPHLRLQCSTLTYRQGRHIIIWKTLIRGNFAKCGTFKFISNLVPVVGVLSAVFPDSSLM